MKRRLLLGGLARLTALHSRSRNATVVRLRVGVVGFEPIPAVVPEFAVNGRTQQKFPLVFPAAVCFDALAAILQLRIKNHEFRT